MTSPTGTQLTNNSGVWKNPKIWSLAIGQVLVWAGLFYLFPALLTHWEAHFGWSRDLLTFGFSGALITAAVAGLAAGRIIDRGHGRILMAGSALAGGALLAGLPQVSAIWQFYLIWLALGVAMAGCLYEPCFAYLTRLYQAQAKRPIVMVTLVAGFAGTICFPVSSAMTNALNWQASIWLFAALNCFVAAPLLWFGAGGENVTTPGQIKPAPSPTFAMTIRPLLRQPTFWALAITFGSLSINHGMIISHILPLLESRGVLPAQAVIAASLIGVAQVLGRLSLLPLEQHISMIVVCGLSLVGLSLASVGLAFAGISVIFLGAFVLLQGSAIGVASIAKPIVTAEVLGRTNFGTISAMVSILYVWGFALAPGLAGFIWMSSGYDVLLKSTFALALLGIISLFAASRYQNKSHTG